MLRGRFDIPVRRLVRRLGFDVERRRPVLADLLRARGVGTVLDVGANVGQYGRRLRAWGWRGRIVSFEPLPDAFAALARRAARDGAWDAHPFALGRADDELELRVADASVFSSFRAPRAELLRMFANASPRGACRVPVRRLDDVLDQVLGGPAGALFLKVDTQGFEDAVLDGATRSLDRIDGVQVEMSLTPLYDGEADWIELARRLAAHGFEPALIEPVVFDPRTHRMLQIDGVFLKGRP